MKNRFVKNMSIMGITGIFIKLLGMMYRVFLANFISENAVAYYGLAYPWYNFLVVFSSIALPVALAKLIAETIGNNDEQGRNEIFIVSRWLTNIFGIISAFFLIVLANSISKILGTPGNVYTFYVLGISAYFVSLNAAYRGFFQGHQKLEFFGISQLVEQICRVGIGLIAVIILSRFFSVSDAFLAGAGILGVAFGAFFSLLYLRNRLNKHYKINKIKIAHPHLVVKKILKVVWPIAIGASIMPLISMIDTVVVVRRLMYLGYDQEVVAVMYSFISYYSLPIINLSQVVFSSMQLSLLPLIANSFVTKSSELKNQIGIGLLLSLVLGLPMGTGMAVFSKQILLLLYPSKASLVTDAASVLMWLSIAIVFLSVYSATTAMLQGMDAYKQPMYHMVIGAFVKIISEFILLGIPSININAAAISTLIAYVIASFLNIRLLLRLQNVNTEIYKKMGLTVVVNLLMTIIALCCYKISNPFLGLKLSLLLSIFIAVPFYTVGIIKLKIINRADFNN